MAEAVARVARRANEVVENKEHHLDLSDCKLNKFPISLYMVLSTVSEEIFSISLANNEIKALTGKFFTTFTQLQDLTLEGNNMLKLPDEVCGLTQLKSINLSRNKFQHFPEMLLAVSSIEHINLADNEIKDVAVEKLRALPALRTVNLRGNPLNKDGLDLTNITFELIV
ncbi:leucine-rich repeat-containing protein 20 [Bombina bombina]|uniref:leucine-rich repeat-containing protein 20 n=1 Tax=Bombina bombina TaxID=8345 RepID=UPI00235ACE2B|nr:leucine-rich repeat-containing protein 20 [Bombina bombina]